MKNNSWKGRVLNRSETGKGPNMDYRSNNNSATSSTSRQHQPQQHDHSRTPRREYLIRPPRAPPRVGAEDKRLPARYSSREHQEYLSQQIQQDYNDAVQKSEYFFNVKKVMRILLDYARESVLPPKETLQLAKWEHWTNGQRIGMMEATDLFRLLSLGTTLSLLNDGDMTTGTVGVISHLFEDVPLQLQSPCELLVESVSYPVTTTSYGPITRPTTSATESGGAATSFKNNLQVVGESLFLRSENVELAITYHRDMIVVYNPGLLRRWLNDLTNQYELVIPLGANRDHIWANGFSPAGEGWRELSRVLSCHQSVETAIDEILSLNDMVKEHGKVFVLSAPVDRKSTAPPEQAMIVLDITKNPKFHNTFLHYRPLDEVLQAMSPSSSMDLWRTATFSSVPVEKFEKVRRSEIVRGSTSTAWIYWKVNAILWI